MKKNLSTAADYPNALAFWDKDRNACAPEEVSAGSDKKVNFKCAKSPDHVWTAQVKSLTLQGTGCPYCSNRRLSVTNSLFTCFPDLATEFDEKLNKNNAEGVMAYSDKKYWWRCSKNPKHVWESGMNKRTKSGRGCPYCAGHKVLEEESLAAIFPDLVAEWDWDKNAQLNPSALPPKSDKRVWWICSSNIEHKWQAQIKNRSNGNGCPYCSGIKRTTETSIVTLAPILAKQFDSELNSPTKAEEVAPSSSKEFFWRCLVNPNHVWKASPNRRKSGENGCPMCSMAGTSKPELRILAELSTVFDEVLHRKKLSSIEADIFIPSLNIAVEYDGARYHHESLEKDLTKNKALEALDISVIRIREAPLKRLSDYDLEISANSLDKPALDDLVKQICRVGNVSKKSILDSAKRYQELENYADEDAYLTYVSEGRRALGTSLRDTNPELMEEWDSEGNAPLVPENFSKGSRESVKWICKNNPDHTWIAPIANRAAGTQCPYCTRVLTSPENSFVHRYPQIAAEWHGVRNEGLEINTFSATSQRQKVWWQCSKDPSHEWMATPAERCKFDGLGCPFCSNKRITKETSLEATHPVLASQWHPQKNGELRPSDVFAGGKQKVWWLCPKVRDHEWEARLYSRADLKTGTIKNGCPFCSGRRAH